MQRASAAPAGEIFSFARLTEVAADTADGESAQGGETDGIVVHAESDLREDGWAAATSATHLPSMGGLFCSAL